MDKLIICLNSPEFTKEVELDDAGDLKCIEDEVKKRLFTLLRTSKFTLECNIHAEYQDFILYTCEVTIGLVKFNAGWVKVYYGEVL